MRTPKNRLQELAQNLHRHQPQKQSSGQGQQQSDRQPLVEAKSFDRNQPINLHASGQMPQRWVNQHGSVEAMAFDYNQPIELRYNRETDGYVPTPPTYAGAYSVTPDLDFGSEAFEVESFDDVPSPPTYADAQSVAPNPDFDSEAFNLQSFHTEAAPPTKTLANNAEPVAAAPTMPLKPEVVAEPHPLPTKSALVEPKPPAPQEVATEDDFLEDLQAILNGEKTYDGDRKQVVEVSPQANQPSRPEPSTPTPVQPAKQTSHHDLFDRMAQGIPPEPSPTTPPTPPTYSSAHSVFDRMGKNMAFANSFDLGTISLQQRFDEFDRILDIEEKKSKPKSTHHPESQKPNEFDDGHSGEL